MRRFACLVALLVCGLACSEAVRFDKDPAFGDFMSFVTKFNKQYSNLEELAFRFANFKATIERVNQRRADHFLATGESGEGVFGVTKFSDLSPEEFKSTYLGFRPSAQRPAATTFTPSNDPLPTKFDWRDKGAITDVKDQGQCGSCWAFSAAEEIESRWFQAGNSLVELSPQQIVSCDNVDQGCNGGDTPTAYQYVEQAGGLEDESDYPYTSGDGDSGSCHFSQSKIVAHMTGMTYATPPCYDSCGHQNETTLQASIAQVGPVSICVYAESWQDYSGGVLSSNCPHGYTDLDHCVQLVGYDTSQSSPYWIVRNSWNTDWGEDGYIYVQMGKNLCGVADEATIVNI